MRMYWKKIHQSLVVFALVLSAAGLHGQSDKQEHRFQKAINEFVEARERGEHGNPDVLFVGSSSFTLYIGFEEDFEGLNALNLGFGGSQLSDILYFWNDVIEPYNPKQIMVYEGDNDLWLGMNTEEFMNDVKTFVRMVQIRKPGTHISFLAPKPSPSRREKIDLWKETHNALYKYAIETPGVDFIDISQPMYQLNGQLKPEIWKSDSLHMNRKGYEIWGPIIRSYIR